MCGLPTRTAIGLVTRSITAVYNLLLGKHDLFARLSLVMSTSNCSGFERMTCPAGALIFNFVNGAFFAPVPRIRCVLQIDVRILELNEARVILQQLGTLQLFIVVVVVLWKFFGYV